MSDMNTKNVQYRFGTESIKDDDSSEYALHVVNFYGEEAISRPYWFRLNLTSRDPNLDPQDFVNLPGRLSIIRGDQTSYIHGIVSSFELSGRDGDWFMYRAMLSPRVWALSLTHQSRAFQNRSVPEIVRMILEEHGVPHKIELRESYPTKQYVVQYNETDLAFIARLLAHDGIRFSFVQEEQREVMHLFDSRGQDPWVEGSTEVAYRLPDGLVGNSEYISDFILREQAVPGKVVLRDYNFRDQHADLTTEKETQKKGTGEIYEYGSHHKDRSEGDRLIKVRQEEVDSQQRLIAGRSSCIGFRAGHRFTLTHHHRDDLNEDYLLVRVRHFGGQEQQFGTAGIRDNDNSGLGQDYRNEFGCAPAMVSFRTPRLSIVNNFFTESFFEASFESRFSPVFNRSTGDTIINVAGDQSGHGKFYGLMTANVVGDGPYAAIDENGDYLAKMPFDRKGEPSRPLRLTQPYAGKGEAGFHYPAHAGNEIVFACVDGDPDRPLALGFAPNPDHPSPVTSENSSQHIFKTTSNNLYLVEDKEDNEGVKLYTPHGETLFYMGKSEEDEKNGVLTSTDNGIYQLSGGSTLTHAEGGIVLSAWEKGGATDFVAGIQTYALPVFNILMGHMVAYEKGIVKNFKRKPESFNGRVKEVTKSALSSYNPFDKTKDLIDKLKTGVKIHSHLGAVLGHFDGAKSFFLKDLPGIKMTSRGGISSFTLGSFGVTAVDGVSMRSVMGAEIQAADSIGLVAGRGISAFAYDKGIDILSAKDPIKIVAREEAIVMRAKENLILDSMEGHVIMRAEGNKGNLLMAGQEVHMGAETGVYISDDKEIILKCGSSKLVMKKDGTIELEGKDIKIEGKGGSVTQKATKDFKVEGADVAIDAKKDFKAKALKMEMEAKTDAKIAGLQVKAEAKVKMDVKGTITEVVAKAVATIKGALTKAG